VKIVTDTVNIEGLTLANVIWRKFRRQPPAFIEKILAINPGLGAFVEIPVGTVISFPIEEIAVAEKKRDLVRFL
jgi:phage tail protein X